MPPTANLRLTCTTVKLDLQCGHSILELRQRSSDSRLTTICRDNGSSGDHRMGMSSSSDHKNSHHQISTHDAALLLAVQQRLTDIH